MSALNVIHVRCKNHLTPNSDKKLIQNFDFVIREFRVTRFCCFWKVLVTTFHSKVAQTLPNFLGYLGSPFCLKLLWPIFSQLSEKLGYFLFHHLVTLFEIRLWPDPKSKNFQVFATFVKNTFPISILFVIHHTHRRNWYHLNGSKIIWQN